MFIAGASSFLLMVFPKGNLRAASFLFAFLIVFFDNSCFLRIGRCSDVDSDLLKEIKTIALPRWLELRKERLKLAFEYEWRFTSVVSKASAPDDRVETVYTGMMAPGVFQTISKSRVLISNPRYIASLKKGETESEFALIGGKYRREGIELKKDYRESEFKGLLTAGVNSYLGLDSLLSDESKIRKLSRSQDLIVAEWVNNEPSGEVLSTSYKLVLDISNEYQIVSSERNSKFERGVSASKTTIEYGDFASLGTIPKSMTETEESTLIAGFKQTNVYEILKLTSLNSVSPTRAEFFTPYYGVPESALNAFDIPPKSKFSIATWIAICVTVGVVLLGVSHWLAKRR